MENQPKPKARFRNLVLRNRDITFANFVDIFAEAMGRRTVFRLDRDLAFDIGADRREIDYESLALLVGRLAAALKRLGVERGDRVAILTLNRVEGVLCGFAAARLGAIPVPLNFMMRAPEVDRVMSNAGTSTLLVDSMTLADNLKSDPASVPAAKRVVLIDDSKPPVPGVESLVEMVASGLAPVPPVQRSDDSEIALIFYTSGTSGFPKGAALPDRSVVFALRSLARITSCFPAPRHSLSLLVMPVAHAGGYTQMLMNYALGIPMLFVSSFDPERVLDLIESETVTNFTGAPVMYRMLENAGAAERDLSSIRIWGGGADAFDDDLVGRFRSYGRRGALGLFPLFVRGYGMAEVNSWCAMSPPFPVGERCAGWVLPGMHTRIVDPETGERVERGEPGELWLRGRSVMSEYWGDAERTALALRDGWFRTGDIVRRGRWGMLFFEDRSSDLIKAGGYKVASSEVEVVMCEHPAIDQVVVVGLDHDVKGQVPVAAVTLAAGVDFVESEVLEWTRERLSAYKCPRRIFVFDSLPVTFSLKPRKAEIREVIERRAVAVEGAPLHARGHRFTYDSGSSVNDSQ